MAKQMTNKQGTMFKSKAVMPAGYCSGDKPNAHLRTFVEEHTTVFDADSDTYRVTEAFDTQVNVKKRKTPITDLHIYWSKKHPEAIRQYIGHYTGPGDLILDPFCGSGMTALVALELGRHAVAIDLSPAATFITKNYCTPVDAAAVEEECRRVLHAVKSTYRWLYETKCDRCDGPAETVSTVYSFTTECVKCLKTSPLFYFSSGNDEAEGTCPHCDEPLDGRVSVNGYLPVESSYICLGDCKPQRSSRSSKSRREKARRFFEECDLAKIRKVEEQRIPFTFPRFEWPKVTRSHVLRTKGLVRFEDLYTHRNLWALCALFNEIRTGTDESLRDALLFIMGTVVFPTSKMCCHEYPSTLKGTYYVPMVGRELSVFRNFEGRIKEL